MNAVKSITITRIFDAPRKLVFDAWLDEKHLQQWWSPRGFTNPVCKTVGHAGGSILIHMAHPDFGEMPMGGKYEEVSPIDKIVFTTTAFPDAEGVPQLQGHNIVLFSDVGKKTKIVLTARIIKAGPGLEAALAGMDQGWSESLDRLGEFVEDTSDRELSITRVLDAPRELVWKVWTEAAHVREWWGPNGFTNTIHKMDVSQGGEWLLTMHGPDGTDYPNQIRYLEIIKNERMIYDHGQPEDGGQFRTFVTFINEGNKTRVIMKGVFKTVEYKNMIVEKYGALEGQIQHMARLEEYITKIKNSQENV